jgi:DNA-binding response OmpR family regulator
METKARILIVDDEPDLVDNLKLALEAQGYRVLTASDGIEALAVLQTQAADLILADIAMPNMNGYQFYERVRENPHWGTIPFVFLTARKLDSDVRYGKEMGVDDYLTKPIRTADLLSVVRGKLRRTRQLLQSVPLTLPPEPEPGLLTLGQLKIDSGQHRVWLGEREVKLSAREFVLLEHLARQPGQVISPQALIQTTHELKTDAVEAGVLLRPLIRSLRRKMGYPTGEMGCLENVRGVGYRLIEPC